MFLFALIDELIYNRICIDIVGKCRFLFPTDIIFKESFTMRDKFRKLTSMVAAATLCAAAISFAGCADSYSIKALPEIFREK